MDKASQTNKVEIRGTISKQLEFSHEIYGEKFYAAAVSVVRESGVIDEIIVMFSERLMDLSQIKIGSYMAIIGEYRSFNVKENDKMRLTLSLFVREAEALEDQDTDNDYNSVTLEGFICKPPVYRKTPLGREIADILLAVNRAYGKSDYIPTVAWGRNAKFAETLNVGDKVKAVGRIQSRLYEKRLSETEAETRTAYEVSVSKIELLDQE